MTFFHPWSFDLWALLSARRTGIAKILLILIFLGWQQESLSQKLITEKEETWFGYFNQTRFTEKSGLWTDVHFRLTNDYVKEKTFSIVRVGYTYYVNKELRLTGGYAYAARYNQAGVKYVPEHRPWQQVQWMQTKRAFNMGQSFRIEQRFRRKVAGGELTNRNNFNWRFRYGLAFTIPLMRKELTANTAFLLFSNEISINGGKEIEYNYFDQNRFFAGAGYQFTSQLSAHVGHLFIFQQEAFANRYLHIHALRLFVIHNLDFRNAEEAP